MQSRRQSGGQKRSVSHASAPNGPVRRSVSSSDSQRGGDSVIKGRTLAGVRLNKFLASSGIGSRRGVEELITGGFVTVNGEDCTNLAFRVSPGDVVKVNGKKVQQQKALTLLLKKPPGYICTRFDERGRQTIFKLIPQKFENLGLSYVGRLDKESEGLLVLSNDGALSQQLAHPRHKIEKEYAVILDRPFDLKLKGKLLHGIQTPEWLAVAERVWIDGRKAKVVLTQGLKRQIRYMFSALDYEVKKLERIRIGSLVAPHLPLGSVMELDSRDLKKLLKNPTHDQVE